MKLTGRGRREGGGRVQSAIGGEALVTGRRLGSPTNDLHKDSSAEKHFQPQRQRGCRTLPLHISNLPMWGTWARQPLLHDSARSSCPSVSGCGMAATEKKVWVQTSRTTPATSDTQNFAWASDETARVRVASRVRGKRSASVSVALHQHTQKGLTRYLSPPNLPPPITITTFTTTSSTLPPIDAALLPRWCRVGVTLVPR